MAAKATGRIVSRWGIGVYRSARDWLQVFTLQGYRVSCWRVVVWLEYGVGGCRFYFNGWVGSLVWVGRLRVSFDWRARVYIEGMYFSIYGGYILGLYLWLYRGEYVTINSDFTS